MQDKVVAESFGYENDEYVIDIDGDDKEEGDELQFIDIDEAFEIYG